MYAPEVTADPRGWAEARSEFGWAELAAPASGPRIQGWSDIDTLLADMDAAGVEKAVLLGWYWDRLETCIEQNNWYIKWVNQHPDRLLGFAAVQPRAGGDAEDEVRRAVEAGLCGIGEVSHRSQGFSMDNPEWIRIIELAIEWNLPVNLHVNEPVGRRHPGRLQDALDDYVWLADRFPELKLILAHWGGLLPFFELNKWVGSRMNNVYYDTAASPLLYHPDIFRAVVDRVGADRVLYGSDYPLRLYPRKQKAPDFRLFLEEIEDAGLTASEKKKILGVNASKLIHPKK